MAGGGQASSSGQGTVSDAAQSAMSGGTAGTAGGAAAAATQNIPQWQKGLLGAVTGSSQYGKNAPAIHQMLQGAMQRPQQAAMPQMQGPPPQAPQMQGPPQGGMPPQGMGQAMGQGGTPGAPPGMQGLSPQMLQQLQQQYPQLFAQKPQGM